MSFPFDPTQTAILVRGIVSGPLNRGHARLSLDTGATMTIMTEGLLVNLGYDLAVATIHRQITTASGVETAPEILLLQFEALGQSRAGFPVLCMNLPASAGIDGVLGLDFFRALTLTIDFRAGQITLA